MNWNFLQNLDIEMIKEFNDFEYMQQFINTFIKTEFSNFDYQILSHPLSRKLFLMFQHTTEYLIKCQDQLKNKINEIQNINIQQKEKIQILKKKIKNKNIIINNFNFNIEKCPICDKKCKSKKDLDLHIQKHHNLHLNSWISIRKDKPINFNKEIDILKDEIISLKEKLKENFQNKKNTENDRKFIQKNNKLINTEIDNKNLQIFEKIENNNLNQKKIDFKQNILEINLNNKEINNNKNILNYINELKNNEKFKLSKDLPINFLNPKNISNLYDIDNKDYKIIKQLARQQIQKSYPLE